MVEAGEVISLFAGRIGRRTSSPPQFGQVPEKWFCAQSAQNVHSNVQIIAAGEAGGRSQSQHSQFGLNASIISSIPPPSLAFSPPWRPVPLPPALLVLVASSPPRLIFL